MKDQIKRILKLDTLLENVEGLVETRIALLKLELQQKAEFWVKQGILWGAVAFMGLMALMLLSIGLAVWLGEIWGHISYGFLAVAGGYLLLMLGLVIYLRRNSTPEESESSDK